MLLLKIIIFERINLTFTQEGIRFPVRRAVPGFRREYAGNQPVVGYASLNLPVA